jgi:hypothetical protein
VALKLAVLAPAATVTDAGTASAELSEVSATEAPPVDAVDDNVTVQVELPPDVKGFGEQDKPETPGKEGCVTVSEGAGAMSWLREPAVPVTLKVLYVAAVAEPLARIVRLPVDPGLSCNGSQVTFTTPLQVTDTAVLKPLTAPTVT